ncbi:N-acyl-D-amino-acid deacylase family protein [Steroidobacter sp.]|uniref:N-acyl-D-amino-acid deacylase family protein n=1 Tax=Steroidobacter sp. TaxID=1978227 RepID=UPI001A4FBEFA|nr:D-aminoacylase [Steroidobacter sp.]MBL8265278.1 D-aminoacylase [Steroidobacter sp.]
MPRCDLIIRDVTLYDGTGSPARRGDLAVEGDRIAACGDLGAWSGTREIVASGLALAPGFIDTHTHDDRMLLSPASDMTYKLSQGVTTVVVGNCGVSLSPATFARRPPSPLDLLGDERSWVFDSFAAYSERLKVSPPPLNALALVGHMTLRVDAMQGDTQRAATDREIALMRERLAFAMQEGARGLSSGLAYPPSLHAPTEEVMAVAEVIGAYGGIYTTHLRDEGQHVIQSIEEALQIGKRAGARVVISHHKCAGPENFGRSKQTLALIDRANLDQDVDLDAYPYAASSTSLLAELVREDIPIRVSWSVPHPDAGGRTLAEVAAEWGIDQRAAARRLSPAGAIYFSMDEADVQRILAHPRTMIGSDGLPNSEGPHPRLWGTFPRVLGHYARDLGLFDMATAIYKMTSRPATVFGIENRGILEEGAYADLVLFDPLHIADRATFEKPTEAAAGIRECWVNGTTVYRGDTGVTGARSGRLLRSAMRVRDAIQ